MQPILQVEDDPNDVFFLQHAMNNPLTAVRAALDPMATEQIDRHRQTEHHLLPK